MFININGREIGPGHKPYFIAELSSNHSGNINRALKLIEKTKECGADAVKLQTYTADTITIDHDGLDYGDLVDNSRLVVDTRNAIDNETVDMEKVQKA